MKKILLFFFIIITVHLYSTEEQKSAYIIPIHGEINRSMTVFIKKGLIEAKKNNTSNIIFEIDTFGGRVDSALQITTLIGSIDEANTIAYVTALPESKGVSWSAGALISFSCSSIYMSPGTSIGAAAPVHQSKEGMQLASEKIVSAVRAQMAAIAEKNNYPKNIALAMVDSDVELYEVYIDNELQIISLDDLEYIKNEAKEKKQTFKKGRIISKNGKLLTLTANEMLKYKISSGTVSNIDKLGELLGIDSNRISKIEKNYSDELITWLTSTAIMGILLMIALLSLYIEITSPGFGIPGTIAIISFSVIFALNGLIGRIDSFEIIIFLIGIVLLILEIFIIPGFGIAGLSGIILILLSIILSMQDFVIPQFEWQWDIFKINLSTVFFSFLLSIIGIIIIIQFFPKLKFFNRLALFQVESAEEGFTVQSKDIAEKYLGLKGIAVTVLRPAGKAEIDDDIIEVESDGEFINKNDNIEVIKVNGNRILVRKC